MMEELLQRLAAEDNLRTLPHLSIDRKQITVEGERYLNLSSNDYLGIATRDLHRDFMRRAAQCDDYLLSNPSSRLITGNSPDYDRLEATLSECYGGRAALVVGSGYMANAGVLPVLTSKEDLILCDKLMHASLIDGLRLCTAQWYRFNHNDMNHLERLLKENRHRYRTVWIVTESIFSMDGDRAPLSEIEALRRQYDCKLYLDEAHAFGVYGPDGLGLAAAETIECDILIATLGKAIASQGAFILTDPTTRDLLINRMRTLIFSTALPPLSLRWSEEVIHALPQMEEWRKHLHTLSELLGGAGASHILPIMAGENRRAIEMSRRFREAGFWVMPIRTPTVPAGKARVRVSLNAALTREEVEKFKSVWNSIG